jgi:hypothetical protein
MKTKVVKSIKKETKLSKKEKVALLHLFRCGSVLSNIAFNESQSMEIPPALSSVMKRWYKEWDKAKKEAEKVISKLLK